MAERRSPKPKVVGSIPTAPATNKRTHFNRKYNMSNNSQVETITSSADKVKITLAVLALIAGIFAYSYFSEFNIYARVGMFIGGIAVAALLLWLSDSGKRMLGFASGSYNEMKRVVWPTRKETIQMTGIVFAFVTVMAIILWLMDKLIGWLIYGVLLGWN